MVQSIAGRGNDVILTYQSNGDTAEAVVTEVEEMAAAPSPCNWT